MRGVSVPVKLIPKPLNPCDSRAIAFVCQLNGKSHTIGYVVSELIEEVHAAIDGSKILSVEFAWIGYCTDWSRSGLSFFAAIASEKNGQWSSNTVQSASTRY